MGSVSFQPSGYPAPHGLFFGTNQGGPGSKPPGPSPDGDSFSIPAAEVPEVGGVPADQEGAISPPASEVQ